MKVKPKLFIDSEFLRSIEIPQRIKPPPDINTLVEKHYHGPLKFEEIFSLGRMIESFKNSKVTPKDRISDSIEGFEILGSYDPRIIQAMANITEIVNSATDEDTDARFYYQTQMVFVFQEIAQRALLNAKGGVVIIEPWRAGNFCGLLYNIPEENRGHINAKRLPIKTGEMYVGLFDKQFPKIDNKTKVIIPEGCVATGSTVAALLALFAEYPEEFKPASVEVDAAGVVQQGAEFLIRIAKILRINFSIRTGVVFYAMDDHHYILRTGEEGYPKDWYAVGDAGDWLRALPPKYNRFAPWNLGRKI